MVGKQNGEQGAKRPHPPSQTKSRKQTGSLKASVFTSNDVLPPAKLTFPNWATNWRPNVEGPEPTWDVSHLKHYWVYRMIPIDPMPCLLSEVCFENF